MPGPVFLEGDAVDLHTIEHEDADFLQALVNDPRVRTDLGSHDPVTGTDEEEWIESAGDDGDVHLLICADGDPVGTVGLDPLNEAWGTAELGYMVDPDHWGQGYATDAVDSVSTYALDERRLVKLVAKVFETNAASRRVLEKNGFEHEATFVDESFLDGERVDVLRFALFAGD